jgi:hypothetical protein
MVRSFTPLGSEPGDLEPLMNGGGAAASLFVWLVADGWCWFVLREKYC